MRYFFRRTIPQATRILLVESGSRHLFEKLIPLLQERYGDETSIDLVTCYAGVPEGFLGKVFRVTDYVTPAVRKKLVEELIARQYSLCGIICSAEPIMTKWKWMLGARIPAKIFIVNENADFFWLDWGQWRAITHFVSFRAGITGAAAVPTLARILFFPVTFLYLLLFAVAVHLRRRIRIL